MRIAIVGSGISGIAAAAVLQRFGHELVVFERSELIGGVWAQAYPAVRLQNIASQYHLSEFPWPFAPDPNPSAAQILRYLDAAVDHYALDVRAGHEVVALTRTGQAWRVEVRRRDATREAHDFDFVVLAVGQYTQPKLVTHIPGREEFEGEILTERDIRDLDQLAAKRVAIVGFGKTAVDLAALAAARGSRVEQIFRTPRWLIPQHIAGLVHYTFALFTRVGSVMIPAWAQPRAGQRLLHTRFAGLVRGFWAALGGLVRRQHRAAAWGLGPDARARIAALEPAHGLVDDMRSAAALAPVGYYRAVAKGEIIPHRGTLSRFEPDGVTLTDGTKIPCDAVISCLGSGSPVFPFMAAEHRDLLEGEPDGVQLYRHLIHPQIPGLAFAGYNHGFLHVPATEVGMVWVAAMLAGELELPSDDEMLACIDHVRGWKRAHINFEPSRSCAVNTRFHQYLDIMLDELGVESRRKANPLAEWVSRYEASDYAGVVEEYQRNQARRGRPRKVSSLRT